MFKRITFTLLASALAYSAGTINDMSPAYTPKITEQQLQNAQRAPVYTSCVNPGQVAFTFDDGPNPATTSKVLKFLKDNNIVGTFFINAENKERTDSNIYNLITNQESIDIVKRTVQEGHYIGSHTFYHKDLFEGLDDGTMEMNIDTMTDKIQEIIGAKPVFFRLPKGNGGYDFDEEDPVNGPKNEKIQKYLGASGFKIIMWGADTRDWENKENVEADIAELNKHMSPEKASPEKDSFIILMHDIYDTTADLALPRVYEYVTNLGYKVVSLVECLGMTSAYQDNVEPTINSNLTTNNVGMETKPINTTIENNLNASSDAFSNAVQFIYCIYAIIFSLFFLY